MKKAILALAIAATMSGYADDYNKLKTSLPSQEKIQVMMGSENVLLTKVEATALRAQMTILLGKLEGAEVINKYTNDEKMKSVNGLVSAMVESYPTHVGGDGTTLNQASATTFAVISATPTVVAMLAADRMISWLPMIGVTRYSMKGSESKPVNWKDARTWKNIVSKKDTAFYQGQWTRRWTTGMGLTLRATVGAVGVMVVIDEVNSTESIVVMAESERAALEQEVKSVISQLDDVIF